MRLPFRFCVLFVLGCGIVCLANAQNSVLPNSGSGPGSTTPSFAPSFTFTATGSNGYASIAEVQIVLNWGVLASVDGCFISYFPESNLLYLASADANGPTLGPVSLGSGTGALDNGLCKIYPATSTVSGAGSDLTINLALAFDGTSASGTGINSGFIGPQTVFMATMDTDSNTMSPWQQVGTWTPYAAQSTAPTPVSVTLNLDGTYTFTASDINQFGTADVNQYGSASNEKGAGYIMAQAVGIGTAAPGANPANNCFFALGGGTNWHLLQLVDDTGTNVTAAAAGFPNFGVLENSQCSIDVSKIIVSEIGNQWTATMEIKFKGAYSPANVYWQMMDRPFVEGYQFLNPPRVNLSQQISITPTSDSDSGSGKNGTFSVAAASGVIWTAVSDASWITITSGASGSANGTVNYTIASNTSGASRTGNVIVTSPSGNGQLFSINQIGNSIMNPNSGSTATPTGGITFSVVSPGTTTSITTAQIGFSAALWNVDGCWLTYDVAHNSLSLLARDGTPSLTPVTPTLGGTTGSGTVDNGLCQINGANSTIVSSNSGASLTITLGIAFDTSFIGTELAFVLTQDSQSTSPWQQVGFWTPYPAQSTVPSADSVTLNPDGTYSLVSSDVNGYGYIVVDFLAMGTNTNWDHNCAFGLVRGTGPNGHFMQLLNDAGTGVLTAVAGVGPVNNSQCTVTLGANSWVESGNQWQQSLSITFASGFSHPTVYRYVIDRLGMENQTQHWAQVPLLQGISIAPATDSAPGPGKSGTIAVSVALPSVTWTAVSSTPSWLTISSGASGTGNGTVGYTIAPNTSNSSRTGNITVTSQTGNAQIFNVSQTPSDIVTPGSGSGPGSTTTPSFTFTATSGSTISLVEIVFSTNPPSASGCYVKYAPSTNTLTLLASDGSVAGTTPVGTSGSTTVDNGRCRVNGANSSVSAAGFSLTLKLALAFDSGFTGTSENIYIRTTDSFGTSAWQTVGTFTPSIPAIQSLSVQGVTATQAILSYTAPTSAACQVEVSESSTYMPLVNDVNANLFTNANLDSRTGSTTNVYQRLFVIGKRSADVAQDTRRYSRALQTATPHYFRITCTDPTDSTKTVQVIGTFTTANIPFGNAYAETEAIDPQRPGSYALPTLSPTDRTQQVIDPQTGVAIKRLQLPHDVAESPSGIPFSIYRSSAWGNLGNLGAIDGQAATISGNTGNLFLAIDNNKPFANFTNSPIPYGGNSSNGLGYYQAHMIAAVNPGGSAPANPDDAKIVACLTLDAVSCYPGSSQYEATLNTNYNDTAFGTTSVLDLWQSNPGVSAPRRYQEAGRGGSVMCDGSGVVKLASGDVFGTWWSPGSSININSTGYTISSITHTTQLVVTANCPSTILGSGAFDPNTRTWVAQANTFTSTNQGQTLFIFNGNGPGNDYSSVIDQVIDAKTVIMHDFPGQQGVTQQFGFPAGYYAYNFGVLVRKKTNSSDTIAIDYASVSYETDFQFDWTLGGGYELCGLKTVTGPNGHQGYNCLMPQGGMLYWVDADSAEAHLFGSALTAPDVGCGIQSQNFDAQDPDKIYCGGKGILYTLKYYGNHSEPPGASFTSNQALNICNPNQTNTPCAVIQQLTPNTDLGTLTAAFTTNPAYAPAFDKTLFTGLHFVDIDAGGNILVQIWRGGNNSIAWNVAFNPNATSNSEGGSSTGSLNNHGCVGGGQPGCVVAAMPAWARPGCRWCTTKGGGSVSNGWFGNATYGWTDNGPGTGPYYVQVIDGTANGTINYVDGSSSLQACPSTTFASMGATGNKCTSLTVASEPFGPNHGSGETGLPGELGAAAVGDRFAFEVQLPINNTEQVMLIKKVPGQQSGTWVYTLWRNINHPGGGGYYTTGTNPNLYTVCNANQVLSDWDSGYGWYWNFADPAGTGDPHGMNATGRTIPPDPSSINNHDFWSGGTWGAAQAPVSDTRCNRQRYCYAMRVTNGRSFDHVISDLPISGIGALDVQFASGSWDGSASQSHPTGGGSMVTPDRGSYMFDGRPYRGGNASGSINSTGTNPATLVGGQLYKFTASAMPNIDLPYRKMSPTGAFSGANPLVDISSPTTGNVIGTTASDAFKYCVAAVANECRTGASPGDVYVNAPYVRYPYCYQAAQNGNLNDDFDICISGSPAYRDGIMQIAMDKVDLKGQFQRLITKFTRARVVSPFWTPYTIPNGKWMMFEANFPGEGSINKSWLMAKIPPPATYDSVDRTTFIPMAINLPAYSGATSAFIRFGYAENGDPGSFYCTSRKESCIVGSAATSINPSNPFYFEQTEAATWQPIACSNGCTLTIPGIPQRVLYYQYVYRNGSGTAIYTSPVMPVTTP